MKAGGSLIVVLIAMILLYLAISGRFKCLEVFWTCLSSAPGACGCVGAGPGAGGPEGPGGGGPSAPVNVPSIKPAGNSGINPTGAPIYDARSLLPPIQAFTVS